LVLKLRCLGYGGTRLKSNKKKTPELFRRVIKLVFIILILFMISIGLIFLITGITPFISEKVYNCLGKTVVGTKDGWLGFYGGFLGGIIALVGIWFQINRKEKQESKEKFEGLKKYLSYVFRKNIELVIKNDIIYKVQSSLNYSDEFKDIFSREEKTPIELYLPSPKFVEDNLKIIMELDIGEELLSIIKEMEDFNQNIKTFQSQRIKTKGIFDEINKISSNLLEDELKYLDILEIIENFSDLIMCYNERDLINNNLNILNNMKGHIKRDLFKCFSKFNIKDSYKIIESEFSNLQFKERNIDISIKLNDIFIKLLREMELNLKAITFNRIFDSNKEINNNPYNISKILSRSISRDQDLNGYLPKLLEKIKNVSEKLEHE
jgi:hypothetical protein